MIKVNGIDLEFNSLDADCVEKAQNAIITVKEKAEAFSKDPTLGVVAGIRKTCSLVSDCFDEVFGAGTGKIVLGGSSDMGKALEAFAQFATGIQASQKQSIGTLASKYTPNRDARRHPTAGKSHKAGHGGLMSAT